MELKEVISITGKPGLYRVVAQSGRGFIVEALDGKKGKFPVNANHQVALLDEITIYTETEDSLTLKEVFSNIKEQAAAGDLPKVDADPVALRTFFRQVAPKHDEDRVYLSDMKKILKWYIILNESGIV